MKERQELGAKSTGAILLCTHILNKDTKGLLVTKEMTIILYSLPFLVQHSPTCPVGNIDVVLLFTATQLCPTLSVIFTFFPTNKLAHEACQILQSFKVN